MERDKELQEGYKTRYKNLCTKKQNLEKDKKKHEAIVTNLKSEKATIVAHQEDLGEELSLMQKLDMSANGYWCGDKEVAAETVRVRIVTNMKLFNGNVETLKADIDEALRLENIIIESLKEQISLMETQVLSAKADCEN